MSQRWAAVPGPEALASAGEPLRVLTAGQVIYALGPEAMVVVVEAGDRPGDSAVQTADDVTLRAPFPEGVAEALRAKDQIIIGYARMPDGCVPLGKLRVSAVDAHECHLFLLDRLPFEVLDVVRPVAAAPLAGDLGWLARLPADPVAALRAFVTTWYADLPPRDEPADYGSLPAPLASFYAAAAGRREVLGGFNRVYPFVEIPPSPNGGPMAFGAEGRGGFQLTIDPTEPDPAVTYTDLGHGPVVERERLAGFLMQSALLDAAITSPFTGFAAADRLQVERLTAALSPVPLQPLRYPNDPTRLYAGPGVAVAIGDSAAGAYEIYLGARTRAALHPMRDAGVHWQYFAG